MGFFKQWEDLFSKRKENVVDQRRPKTGIIPSGYESLLRTAGIENINYETFQDDFDLDKKRLPFLPKKNNFTSVGNVITKRYPHIRLKRIVFPRGEGKNKIKLLEKIIDKGRYALLSLNMFPLTGQRQCDICLAVDKDENSIIFQSSVLWNEAIRKVSYSFSVRKDKLVQIHDLYNGGNEIVFIDDVNY
jgi:hypothetical protein